MKDKKIFLRKRKMKRKNMVAFVKFPKDEKQRLIEYKKKYSKI